MIRSVNDNLRSRIGTMVVTSDGEGNWTERTEKLEFETAPLQNIERRISQANDTPCSTPPLYDLIAPLGIRAAVFGSIVVVPSGTGPYAGKLIY
jgi:hypothetical protein